MADIFGAFEPMNERSEVCGGREVTMGGGGFGAIKSSVETRAC